jgi:DNA replication protein DnaC
MSAPVVTRDLIVTHTRALKLPGVARVFERLARQARDAHWPHEDYLHEVLSAELASRHESVIRQRLREARFPEVKTLDTFDFPAADGVSATQIHTLARGEWVTAPENLIFAGPIGTGKTPPGDRARRRSDQAETPRALYPRGGSGPAAARSP